jgi:hypothetical protein
MHRHRPIKLGGSAQDADKGCVVRHRQLAGIGLRTGPRAVHVDFQTNGAQTAKSRKFAGFDSACPKTEVNMGTRLHSREFLRQNLDINNRGHGIWHVADGGHPAAGCGRRSVPEVFLVRCPRFTEMHVHIDGPGQNQHSARIHPVVPLQSSRCADHGEHAVLDAEVGTNAARREYGRAVCNDQIDLHCRAPSACATRVKVSRPITSARSSKSKKGLWWTALSGVPTPK